MIYSLKSVNKNKKKIVREVIKLWKEYNSKLRRSFFEVFASKYGWEYIECGSYKSCISKGSIVAKYPLGEKGDYYHDGENMNEIKREFEQWRCASNRFKRHLPKCYAFVNGLLVQDRVWHVNDDYVEYKYDQNIVDKLAKKYSLYDAEVHNVGFSRKGTIKFFDWVYNRRRPFTDDVRGELRLKVRRRKI